MKYLMLLMLFMSQISADVRTTSAVSLTGSHEFTGGNYEYIPNNHRAIFEGYVESDSDSVTGSIVLDTQNNPIEEAYIEWAIPVRKRSNLYLTMGTADVLYGFYNNGLDVLTTGSSTLPQGVYSYDFVKGGFSRVYGLSAEFDNTLDNYPISYKIKYAEGKALVDRQSLLESSLFGGVDSLDVDVEDNRASILSFSINYKDKVEIFLLNSIHKFTLVNVTNSSIKDIPTYLASTPNYGFDIKRVGLKFNLPLHTELTTEVFTLDLETTNPIAKGSRGGYITLHSYWSDYVFLVGRSKAISNRAGSTSTSDNFVGVSYWGDRYSIGIEYHKGDGSAWLTSNPDRVKEFNSTVITFGVQL